MRLTVGSCPHQPYEGSQQAPRGGYHPVLDGHHRPTSGTQPTGYLRRTAVPRSVEADPRLPGRGSVQALPDLVVTVNVIVVYDTAAERNPRILGLCRRYLHHVQRSVFEGSLSAAQLQRFQHEVRSVIVDSYVPVLISPTRVRNNTCSGSSASGSAGVLISPTRVRNMCTWSVCGLDPVVLISPTRVRNEISPLPLFV